MKKLTIEMPIVSQCGASRCAYNQDKNCRAKAITVGDELRPGCDTYFASQGHIQEKTRTAGVGACKISSCRFNNDFECTAENISVDVSGTDVRCMTYSPSQQAVA
jgi:hypothetical protein